jgi:hypothetical protein
MMSAAAYLGNRIQQRGVCEPHDVVDPIDGVRGVSAAARRNQTVFRV